MHRYAANDGTGGYVAELVPRIAKVHRVTLYAARVATPPPDGVQVVPVPAIMGRAYAAILSFPLGLRAVRREHDLFHVQGWIASYADIVTAHIVMAAWRQAARAAGVPAPLGERTLGSLVQSREASLFRRARRVIAPSEKVRDEIARHYGRTEGVRVVRHGFLSRGTEGAGGSEGAQGDPAPGTASAPSASSAPSAARQALGLPLDATIALFVGDLRKGFDVALEAVRQVPGVRLAVVSRSRQGPVMERAARAGMRDRMHWIGALEDPSLAYQAADFLLHPTIYDAFGLVVAEGMAHGLPVVTTREAGIAELIRHGASGWLVAGDATVGTIEAVHALARDPGLRRRLGEGARAVAAKRSWDDVARETLAVYDETVRS